MGLVCRHVTLLVPAQAGVAHLVEHMVFKGTRRRGIGQAAAEVVAEAILRGVRAALYVSCELY